MTITLAAVYTPIGFQVGSPGPLPRVRHHPRRRGGGVGHRGADPLTGHELALRARARRGRPADPVREPRVRGGPRPVRRMARRRAPDPVAHRGGLPAGDGGGAGPCTATRAAQLAPVEDQSHIFLFLDVAARRLAGGEQPRLARSGEGDPVVPRDRLHVVADGELGRIRRAGGEELEERDCSTEEMYGEVFGAVSQIPGLGVPAARPAAADAGAVRRRAGPPGRRAARADAGDRRPGGSAPACRAASSSTWTPT